MKALQHLKTINHHKWLVCQGCFKVGLYKQGLLHDLSKYSPTEFLVGCKFYQGTRSPNNAEREVKGYSAAWLHHKGRKFVFQPVHIISHKAICFFLILTTVIYADLSARHFS